MPTTNPCQPRYGIYVAINILLIHSAPENHRELIVITTFDFVNYKLNYYRFITLEDRLNCGWFSILQFGGRNETVA